MSAEKVLTAFQRDGPYLFLGAALPLSAWCPLPLRFSDDSATHSSSVSHCLLHCTGFAVDFVVHAQ
jgi:hypothetical protein